MLRRRPIATQGMLRRSLLQTGGLLLAMPWLELFARPVRAATPIRRGLTAEGFAKRCAIVYVEWASLSKLWVDGNEAPGVHKLADFKLKRILEPLEPYKEKMNLIKGLRLMGQGAGGHVNGATGVLTGHKLIGNKDSGSAAGPSIDQRMAQELGGSTPIKSLELAFGMERGVVPDRIVYSAPVTSVPPIPSPYVAFDRAFADFDPNADPGDGSAQALRLRRQKVLQASRARFDELKFRLGQDDRHRLDQHVASINDLVEQLDAAGDLDPTGCVPPDLSAVDGLPGPNTDFGKIKEKDEALGNAIVRAHMDVLAAALGCGITNIGTIASQACMSHALSHQYPNTPAQTEEFTQVQVRHAQRLTHFVDRLAAIPEGNGTVLDNTMVLWCFQLGVANNHALTDTSWLLVGNAGGAFPMNRYLQYDPSKKIPHNKLLVSLLNAMGLPDTEFGNPEWTDGNLAELL